MTFYKRVDVCEGVPVQYVGVYVTQWRPEWGQPTAMFVEVEDDDPVHADVHTTILARCAALTAQRDAALNVCKATVIGIEDALDAGGELEDSVWHPAVRKAWLQAKAIIEVQKEN